MNKSLDYILAKLIENDRNDYAVITDFEVQQATQAIKQLIQAENNKARTEILMQVRLRTEPYSGREDADRYIVMLLEELTKALHHSEGRK